jgi:Putative beta-barrel porin-2, OmpL-like. bbp2
LPIIGSLAIIYADAYFGNLKTNKGTLFMKKLSSILVATIVALTSIALADSAPEASAQDTKKMVQNNFVETAQKGIKLSGYVDAGYSYNFTGSTSQGSQVNSRYLGDSTQKGDFNLYAVKIALEKAMTSENKAQAGFRADVMIGEDAQYLINRGQPYNAGGGGANVNSNTQANSNALFLEQAYVEIRAPVGNGWDFKVGKFVTILGYEVIERPANMNITYGQLWQNAFPLTYIGVLSSYRFDDYLDAKVGVVNGSNSDNNTTVNGDSDGVALLAALNVTAPSGNANWSNNFQYSTALENNTSYQNGGQPTSSAPVNNFGSPASGYAVVYNSWGNWAPKFANDKLLLAFDSALGNASWSSVQNITVNTTWYGAAVYAKYQFNDWFSLASRADYLGSNNAGKFGTQGSISTSTSANNQPTFVNDGGHVTGNNYWSYTITSAFNVIDNLLIRAEYRLDWGSGIQSSVVTPNSNSVSGVQSGGPCHYAGAEIVYSF